MASFFIFFYFYFLYKLVSERPFSYLSDSWFPPQRPPQSYVRLQRVFGKLEMVNLFWCSHVGKPDIWAPFQHLPGSFESELSFLCRLCGVAVCVCVCQYCWHDWHAVACWQLALWSLAFPPSAVLLLRNCRRPSPPDCGLSGSWFACDCLRYFLNAYSSCVCGFNHTIKTSLGLPVGNLHGNWSSPASVCTAVTLVLLLQTCKQVVGRAARCYI